MNDSHDEIPQNPFEVQQPVPAVPAPSKRPPLPPPKKPKTWLIVLIVVGSVLFAFFIIGAVLLIFAKPDSKKAATTDTSLTEKVDPVKHDVADMVATETYKSDQLGLTLTYPSTWKVTEATDGGTRIESSVFTYPTALGSDIKGNFRIYIRQGARTVDSTYIGRGYAIAPSEKLVYTKPTAGQRTDTLLSSFGYDVPDDFAYFLIAGNFPLEKGDTLGPNYAKEADAFIIAGGYSGDTNKDDLQMNQVKPDYYKTTNAFKQAIDILESIQVR